MARKGVTKWHLKKQEGDTTFHYALRLDDVIISKFVVTHADGTRNDFGWKIKTRRPNPNAYDNLIAKGWTNA